jgi:hypothetical protein
LHDHREVWERRRRNKEDSNQRERRGSSLIQFNKSFTRSSKEIFTKILVTSSLESPGKLSKTFSF